MARYVDLIINFSETVRDVKTVLAHTCRAITKLNSGLLNFATFHRILNVNVKEFLMNRVWRFAVYLTGSSVWMSFYTYLHVFFYLCMHKFCTPVIILYPYMNLLFPWWLHLLFTRFYFVAVLFNGTLTVRRIQWGDTVEMMQLSLAKTFWIEWHRPWSKWVLYLNLSINIPHTWNLLYSSAAKCNAYHQCMHPEAKIKCFLSQKYVDERLKIK